ncbi:glycosyltransferase [Hymenobacter endophyticus]|uniref:Glycosyltransferase n=1 Tax=Hymenobacter endophyticus TaxID=3076335 RepID=A0ABU3TG67_9BACT|nr:glycosyltransferase [Hymenobacter endophyticus]MDU0370354.1 glycosyltransferase [Hymenobacter endophyticus]
MIRSAAPARKNILLLIPQLTYGGAERVFHDHGRELARHHHVVECVFSSQTEVAFPTRNTLVALDVPAGAGLVGKLRSFVQRIRRVKELKREHRIDVCISHLEGADYLNLLSKGPEQVLLCIHNSKRHDPNIRGALGWLRRRVLMPWLYRSADYVVPVSRDLRQELIDMFGLPPQKVVTVNNFFDVEGIRRRSQEPLNAAAQALFSEHPVLITAGRLAREKNQTALLQVLHTLRAAGHAAPKLALLGDGPLRADLLQRGQELGLRCWQVWSGEPLTAAYDVYFFGFQSNPFQYIARAAVSLLSSSTEGFPMALCEAMACGVPVVSTDCPTGPREILAPQTPATQYAQAPEWAEFGILLPLLGAGAALGHSAPVWADTLSRLLAEPAQRTYYAAQAYSRVQDFAPAKIMQQWENLLTESSK